jgi:hypothetical protein
MHLSTTFDRSIRTRVSTVGLRIIMFKLFLNQPFLQPDIWARLRCVYAYPAASTEGIMTTCGLDDTIS